MVCNIKVMEKLPADWLPFYSPDGIPKEQLSEDSSVTYPLQDLLPPYTVYLLLWGHLELGGPDFGSKRLPRA